MRWLAVGCFLMACGEAPPGSTQTRLCGSEARADTFSEGMQRPSANALYSVRLLRSEVEGQPKPPDRGNNRWTLEVLDPAGAPLTDVSVALRPFMPDHGHGTTPLRHNAALEANVYRVGPFDLFMAGFWEFTFTVDRAGQSDTVRYGFCIEG